MHPLKQMLCVSLSNTCHSVEHSNTFKSGADLLCFCTPINICFGNNNLQFCEVGKSMEYFRVQAANSVTG